jgi:hypothetical protein
MGLISSLAKVLRNNPNIVYCAYIQLIDVLYEINGIYTFDSELKYPVEVIREAFVKPATIEKK